MNTKYTSKFVFYSFTILFISNLYSKVTTFEELLKGRDELTAFKVEILDNNKPSIVKFYGHNCPPCRIMKPVFTNLSNELHNELHIDVNFIEIDADVFKRISNGFSIRSIPTFIYFYKGQEVYRKIGAAPLNLLKSKAREFFK